MKKIKNQKHSELFREYKAQKRNLMGYESMVKYLSLEYQTRERPLIPICPEVAGNTEYNFYKERRSECRKRCSYLKRMINQVQRTYTRQNQHIVGFDFETEGLSNLKNA